MPFLKSPSPTDLLVLRIDSPVFLMKSAFQSAGVMPPRLRRELAWSGDRNEGSGRVIAPGASRALTGLPSFGRLWDTLVAVYADFKCLFLNDFEAVCCSCCYCRTVSVLFVWAWPALMQDTPGVSFYRWLVYCQSYTAWIVFIWLFPIAA